MKFKIKTTVSLLLVFAFLLLCFPFSASADSQFLIENGVLIEYNGNAKNVTIPSDVYRVADSAFYANNTIQSVDLSNVSVVGNNAFRNCTRLSQVSGYDNVTSCGAYAFYGTPFFEDYTEQDLVMGSVLVSSKAKGSYICPVNIKSVASYAFSGNKQLTSVTLGDNVASVGEGAFYNCTSLANISVGSQVTYIGAFAFEGTPFLSSNDKEFLILGNGILVDYTGESAVVDIPDDVVQIAAGAFYDNKNIESVSIPDTVSGIGMRSFAGCTGLKSVNLPASLKLLDKEAFASCTALVSIKIPSSVEIVGESVFFGCAKLARVEYLTDADISRGLFANCSGLTSIMVASDVKNIYELAFYNCSSLIELSLPGTVDYIYKTAFNGSLNLTVWCDSASYAYDKLSSWGINVAQIGDANGDGKLNIKDATHIQKATAGLVTIEFSDTLRADADFNATVNVRDATWIQKKIAGIF